MFITNTIKYIGVNDHHIDLFEGQYPVPNGMAYNSYLILDEKIAVMDSVEARFADRQHPQRTFGSGTFGRLPAGLSDRAAHGTRPLRKHLPLPGGIPAGEGGCLGQS